MSKMIFVNLPVKDLAASTRFYKAIGCQKNDQFSDRNTASMVWSDRITFQLLTRDYFATFTSKQIPDAHRTCQIMVCVTCDSRESVDSKAQAAASAGGKVDSRTPIDVGFLYNRAVDDPDGHVLEMAWLNPAAMRADTAASA